MKPLRILSLIVGIVLTGSVSAYAAEVVAGVPQSIAEFQRLHAGTKPAVAAAKYQESQILKKMPQTTLSVSQLRLVAPSGNGTKPSVVETHATPHTWSFGKAVANKPAIRA